MSAIRCDFGCEAGYLFERSVGRRGRPPDAAGNIAGRRLQYRILQGPGWRAVFIVGAHVEINRIHFLVLKNAEVRQSAPATGGGGDGHCVRGLLAVGGDTCIQACGIAVSVAPAADRDAGKSTAAGGASRTLPAAESRADSRSSSSARCCSTARPGFPSSFTGWIQAAAFRVAVTSTGANA